jgi:hypothetical protein
MLRIHLMQQWFSPSDPAMEDALIEVATICRFAGIDLISDRIPPSARKVDASLLDSLFPPGGLMEKFNASLQRGS